MMSTHTVFYLQAGVSRGIIQKTSLYVCIICTVDENEYHTPLPPSFLSALIFVAGAGRAARHRLGHDGGEVCGAEWCWRRQGVCVCVCISCVSCVREREGVGGLSLTGGCWSCFVTVVLLLCGCVLVAVLYMRCTGCLVLSCLSSLSCLAGWLAGWPWID